MLSSPDQPTERCRRTCVSPVVAVQVCCASEMVQDPLPPSCSHVAVWVSEPATTVVPERVPLRRTVWSKPPESTYELVPTKLPAASTGMLSMLVSGYHAKALPWSEQEP